MHRRAADGQEGRVAGLDAAYGRLPPGRLLPVDLDDAGHEQTCARHEQACAAEDFDCDYDYDYNCCSCCCCCRRRRRRCVSTDDDDDDDDSYSA